MRTGISDSIGKGWEQTILRHTLEQWGEPLETIAAANGFFREARARPKHARLDDPGRFHRVGLISTRAIRFY